MPWESVFLSMNSSRGTGWCVPSELNPYLPCNLHTVLLSTKLLPAASSTPQSELMGVVLLSVHTASPKPDSWKVQKGALASDQDAGRALREDRRVELSPAWRNRTKALLCEDHMGKFSVFVFSLDITHP